MKRKHLRLKYIRKLQILSDSLHFRLSHAKCIERTITNLLIPQARSTQIKLSIYHKLESFVSRILLINTLMAGHVRICSNIEGKSIIYIMFSCTNTQINGKFALLVLVVFPCARKTKPTLAHFYFTQTSAFHFT